MTTIIYDHKNKQIACDSRTTNSWMIVTDTAIKYREKNGIMWFLAGRRGESETFIEHFKELEEAHKALDNVGFFIDKKQVYLANIDGGIFRSNDLNHSSSVGSGCDFALAALDMGKTAKESVEYSITRDYGSGGKVHVYDIEKEKFI